MATGRKEGGQPVERDWEQKPGAGSRSILEDVPQQSTGGRAAEVKPWQHPHPRNPLTGVEFTRRWALHILPKGFVKSRCFGGFSCRHRKAYLSRCRALLGAEQPESESAETPAQEPAEERKPAIACPHCQTPMECISHVERPGWNRVFNGCDRPWWYDPFGHALEWDCRRSYREPPDG